MNQPKLPRKAPRQQRSAETVHAILEAAARIFERDGMAGTTNEIARVAGVSVGSLYQYFPDKRALITALHEQHTARLGELFAQVLSSAKAAPLGDVLHSLIAALIDEHLTRPRLQQLLHAECAHLERSAAESQATRALAGQIQTLLEQHRTLIKPEPSAATFVLMKTAESLIHEAVLAPPAQLTPQQLQTEIVTIIERYLGLSSS